MRVSESERMEETMKGIRHAWIGIPEPDRQAALAYAINYAKTHQQFQGGDILSAWRATNDQYAQQNWRNRWGGLMHTLASKSFGVIAKIGEARPRNSQSHGSYAAVWESQIYREYS